MIYKANKFYGLPGLAIPLLLLAPLFEGDGQITNEKLLGYGVLTFFALFLTLLPLGAKLEISNGHIRSYFWGFCVSHVEVANVIAATYGNLFKGGLGFGKGLIIQAATAKKSKSYSFGEKFFNKDAIMHAKQVLESHLGKKI